MKILLINNNPVVSRLTALSARKEDIEIDEIQEVTELSSDSYDIVFVDSDSWSKDVRDVISDNIKTQKTVLFYADGDEDEKVSFDLAILKPFLPSEVSAVIRSIEEVREASATPSSKEDHFNILDDPKADNRDELFDLDGLDEIEEKKEEISLELEDVSFDDKLEEAFPLKINTLDDDLFDNEPKLDLDMEEELVPEKVEETPKNEIDNDLFDLDLSDEIPSLDDDLFSEKKKEETLEVMDGLELEFDETVLEPVTEIEKETSLVLEEESALEEEAKVEEVKKETKILDESEIANIKGILTEDIDSDMTLEDLMPPMPSSVFEKEEINEVKEFKNDEFTKVADIDSNVLAQTLAAMPVQNLRELLSGAKVNIKIKFPKLKK